MWQLYARLVPHSMHVEFPLLPATLICIATTTTTTVAALFARLCVSIRRHVRTAACFRPAIPACVFRHMCHATI